MNFAIGALRDWRQLWIGQMMNLDIPANGYRQVMAELLTDRPVAVHAIGVEDSWLVAAGEGLITLKFSTDERVGLAVMGDPETVVYIRTHVETQVVPESDEPPFTTIEPRPAGPSDEIKRLMLAMRLNAERREAALREELDALRQRGDGFVGDRPQEADVDQGEALVEGGADEG